MSGPAKADGDALSLETEPNTPLLQFGIDEELIASGRRVAASANTPPTSRAKVITGSINEQYQTTAEARSRRAPEPDQADTTLPPRPPAKFDTATKALLVIGFFLTLILGFLLGWLFRAP